MAKTILGIFTNREDAERALYKLEKEGYDPKDISIIMKDAGYARKLARDTGATVVENVATGATTGGAIGALAGLLVAAGVIPGVGPLLIGGPLAAALGLSGAAATTVSGAATGALAGGLIGTLVSIGVSKEEAKFYQDRIREGGILIAIPAYSKEIEHVMNILEANGADQIRAIETDKLYEEPEEIAPFAYYEPTMSPFIGVKGGKTQKRRGRIKRK